MARQEKIALFGGTFNPIHNGHLRAAASTADIEELDRVIFIPSYLPPHRRVEGGATASDRYEMVRIACEGDDRFSVSNFELQRKEKNFSIYTVKHFLKEAPPGARIHFLIGTDAFGEIDTWHRVTDLLALCDFLVMVRPGAQFDLVQALPPSLGSQFKEIESKRLVHEKGKTTRLVEIDGLEISSTEIRSLIGQGKEPADLVCQGVLNYILKNKLYR